MTMNQDDGWLAREQAVTIIRERVGGSVGRSQKILQDARAAGEVRFRADPGPVLLTKDDGILGFSMKPGSLISDGLRDQAAINQISSEDLLDWLDRNHPQLQTAPPGGRGFQTNKEASLKARCISWIKHQPAQPIRKREDLKAEAQAEIPGLSGRQFTAAWDEAAPAEWKQAGRRPSQ